MLEGEADVLVVCFRVGGDDRRSSAADEKKGETKFVTDRSSYLSNYCIDVCEIHFPCSAGLTEQNQVVRGCLQHPIEWV